MDGFADVRRLGSAALDLCLVADGTIDAYGERGLNEHDFAAGALIAEEAGCWVRRPRLTSPLEGGPSDDERLASLDMRGDAGDVRQVPALVHTCRVHTCRRPGRMWPGRFTICGGVRL